MRRVNHVTSLYAKAAEDGQRIRRGCDSCQAHQTLDADESGEWHLTVHHHPTCPTVAAERNAGVSQ